MGGETMFLGKGAIYRMGIVIKEFGERMALIPPLRLICDPVIDLGLSIKDWVLNHSTVVEMSNKVGS
jgi:hypothetical protein